MNFDPVTRFANRRVLVLKRESPHIFFATGVAGSVTSTLLACRATLKLSDTLDDIKGDIDMLNALRLKGEYNQDDYRRDLVHIYAKAGYRLAKLYGPSVIVGGLSISLLTGSHVQMTRRNQALMAAYAALSNAFQDYRGRVREEIGEAQERDVYRGVTLEKIGKDTVKVVDSPRSPYAKFFDEYSPHWQKDPELNRLYIQCQQTYANQLLRSRGHIFLNEVYDMLGIDRSRAGAVVGWVISKNGDNYVDFGLFDECNNRFVNGWERSILLDFNVDGVIWDKIDQD